MSDIVLSASVRQNLLSLQSTADLLSQTQNRLSTGNKVNSALDNPTNYFTSQSLNSRASDISNLLDGISNGVQVLQAANTGITSLQKLVDSAKSVAQQALQATAGYSTKSQAVSTAITGATAADILGTASTTPAAGGTFTAGAFTTVDVSGTGSTATAGGLTAGTFTSPINVSGTGSSATAGALTAGTFTAPLDVSGTGSSATPPANITGSGFSTIDVSSSGAVGFTLNVDGTSEAISIDDAAVTSYNSATTSTVDSSALTAQNIADIANYQYNLGSGGSGTPVTVSTGELRISSATTGTGGIVGITSITNTGTGNLGISAGTTHTGAGAVAAASLSFAVQQDSGTPATVTISAATLATYNGDSANSAALITDTAASLSAADIAKIANYQLGANVVSVTGGDLKFTSTTSTGTGSNIHISATAVTGTASNTTGVSDGAGTAGNALVAADSLSFAVQQDSGTPATVTISAATLATYNGDSANSAALISDTAASLSAADIAKIANYQLGANVVSVTGGDLKFASTTSTGTSSNIHISATATTGSTSNTTGVADGAGTAGNALVAADSLAFSVSVDGTPNSVTISAATLATYNGDAANSAALISDTAASLSAADISKLVNYQVGSTVSSVSGGALVFTSAVGSAHSVATSAVTTTGAATNTTGIALHAAATGTNAVTTGGLSGTELKIASTAGGTAVDITFGSGTEAFNSTTGVATNVSTLDQLNTVLAANNLTASIDTSGALTFTTTNEYASTTIGAISGSAVGGSAPLGTLTVSGPVQDANAQNARASLVTQYNNIIQQIKTTAQDSSYNGVNLLNGDQLKLVFNETGKSTLSIAGVQDDPAGLGLTTLTAGTDFVDNNTTNQVLAQLDTTTNTLRAQASSLGSNLSIVQIRQDFSKNLINVLQTGASNLTLADTNEEAANSQALSTRQSIAVSALALANQSQQSVLQLLR